MKHEYHEGPKAGENFEKLARAVFQAPKVAVPTKQPKAKSTAHSPQNARQRQGLDCFLWPRPCRFLAERVCAFAGQFLIGESLPSNLRHFPF